MKQISIGIKRKKSGDRHRDTCCICGRYLKEGLVNRCNAQPVVAGECCKHCDDNIVSPRRLRDAGIEVEDGFISKLNKEMTTE